MRTSVTYRGSGVAAELGAGGFLDIHPCTACSSFDVVYGFCLASLESVSPTSRTAASAHGSSTGYAADSEEEWEVCGGGGWSGCHG